MQRKIYLICLVVAMTVFSTTSFAQKGKSEFAVGYGYFTGYSIANNLQNNADLSASGGVGSFTYRYYLTRDITLGITGAYEDISAWGSFITGAPEVSITYMDTRRSPVRIKFYGAASYGITVLTDKAVHHGDADQSGPKPWGAQLTPFGIRLGRQFAIFAEVGYGYKGLFNAGLSLRVPGHAIK